MQDTPQDAHLAAPDGMARADLPPLSDPDDSGLDLGWHALNYRTAHTVHAHAMWQELERFVLAWGEKCVLAERERCAKVVDDMCSYTGGHGEPARPSGSQIAAAIRKG